MRMDRRAIGQSIHDCRLCVPMTVDELAAASGVSAHRIQLIESGLIMPRWGTVVRLAKAMGADPEKFQTESEDPC